MKGRKLGAAERAYIEARLLKAFIMRAHARGFFAMAYWNKRRMEREARAYWDGVKDLCIVLGSPLFDDDFFGDLDRLHCIDFCAAEFETRMADMAARRALK